MKRILLIIGLLCGGQQAALHAQTSYKDVAVIINTNSAASQTIGNYFKTVRNIPDANMIYVSVDTTEEIDSTMFNVLRSQVEDQLILNNLRDSINYLVTTKGVPLKVNRGNTFSSSSPSSSVESDLMLILGQYSSSIGQARGVISPYFYQTAHFSRAAYGIYLVTRLDAYTTQEVLDLIDRSGPGVQASRSSRFVFDQDPAWVDLSALNVFMAEAKQILEGKSNSVLLDSTTIYLTQSSNLLGYVSWGSNDHYAQIYTQNAIPYNTYAPGALAETYVSTSGRSFTQPAVYGQSLIADLLREGVSGVKGYVYEPFALAMARANVLFDRYTSQYNLAESYFTASIWMSWMDVVVGDPKTTITFSASPLPVQLAGFNAVVVPQTRAITFSWRTISETNNYGFTLQRAESSTSTYVDVPNSFVPGNGTTLLPQNYSWQYANAPGGTFSYRLKQVDLDGTVNFSEPIVVVNGTLTSVEQQPSPAHFALGQNYPNPFNPSTEIKFAVDATGDARLEVYNTIGQRVATLYDGVAEAGQSYSVKLDGSALGSGTYFYRLQSGQKSELKKMVLLK